MKNKGFTLIEILIVISLLIFLLAIVLFATNTSSAKTRDTERLSNVKEVAKALEVYHLEHGSYPVSPGAEWAGNAQDWGGYSNSGPTGYIPNLAPQYISKLPIDTRQENNKGYLYKSNGADYFLLVYKTLETIDTPINLVRPSNPESNDLAIYTPGFANQTVPGEVDGGGGFQAPQTPIANPSSGVYFSGQILTFMSDPGASIYYTYGSTLPADPTENSNLYVGPITLPLNQVSYFKAIAIKNNLSSGIFSGEYITSSGGVPPPSPSI